MSLRPFALVSQADRVVERQLDPMACGHACAVMLAADRGVQLDQANLVAKYRDRHSLQSKLLDGLSAAGLGGLLMEELASSTWRGGDTSSHTVEEIVAMLSERSWAALLGRGRIGHWVVVDPAPPSRRVLVRDPVGVRRSYSLEAFAEAWYVQHAVFEVSSAQAT